MSSAVWWNSYIIYRCVKTIFIISVVCCFADIVFLVNGTRYALFLTLRRVCNPRSNSKK